MDDTEDGMTVTYLQDTAQQAGLSASSFPIGRDRLGWAGFVGPDNQPLGAVFKLYPWEWMVREEFGRHLGAAATIWIEPPWKMLLSNKGILPVLWKLYPRHPLPAGGQFRRPWADDVLGEEAVAGARGRQHHAPSARHRTSKPAATTAPRASFYQDLAPLKSFDGIYPVIGSWLIGHAEGDVAGGMGIRESDTPITTNTSQFVPHLFD